MWHARVLMLSCGHFFRVYHLWFICSFVAQSELEASTSLPLRGWNMLPWHILLHCRAKHTPTDKAAIVCRSASSLHSRCRLWSYLQDSSSSHDSFFNIPECNVTYASCSLSLSGGEQRWGHSLETLFTDESWIKILRNTLWNSNAWGI